jgi:hypothetical protein
MKYGLRSLLIVAMVAPALLAISYWLSTLTNLPPQSGSSSKPPDWIEGGDRFKKPAP